MSQLQNLSRLRTSSIYLIAALACLLPLSSTHAQGDASETEPQGIYFHSWTGSSAGTGWLLCFARRAQRYRCSDTMGNGFDFSLSEDGNWLINTSSSCQGGPGILEGRLLRVDWRCEDISFNSMALRAPYTGADFLVVIRKTEQGDGTLSGDWTSVSTEVSPTTGRALTRREEQVSVAVSGKTFRLTLPDGEYVQGTFIAGDRVAFRVREPSSGDPRFQTLQGSATSREVNVLGLAEIHGTDRIDILILTQSRAPISEQIQHQYRYLLTR